MKYSTKEITNWKKQKDIDKLMDAFWNAEDFGILQDIANALLSIQDISSALERLLKMTHHSSLWNRVWAVHVLGRFTDAKVITVLIQVLKTKGENNEALRAKTASSLSHIASYTKTKRVVTPLIYALGKCFFGDDDHEYDIAEEALVRLGNSPLNNFVIKKLKIAQTKYLKVMRGSLAWEDAYKNNATAEYTQYSRCQAVLDRIAKKDSGRIFHSEIKRVML